MRFSKLRLKILVKVITLLFIQAFVAFESTFAGEGYVISPKNRGNLSPALKITNDLFQENFNQIITNNFIEPKKTNGFSVPDISIKENGISFAGIDFPLKYLPPKEAKQLLEEVEKNYKKNRKPAPWVNVTLEKFLKAKVIDKNQAEEMLKIAQELSSNLHKEDSKIIFINATYKGGGVAELRPETIAFLRNQGFNAEWKIVSAASRFFEVTNHIHRGAHDKNEPPLTGQELEILQLVWIYNFEKMIRDNSLNEDTEVLWIDDPQPLGLLPLIKTFYPHIKIIWRCHIDTSSPQLQISEYLANMLEGKLEENKESNNLLIKYLKAKKKTLLPEKLKIDLAVFHTPDFAKGMNLDTNVPVFIMGPAINPLSYKNIPLSDKFLEATRNKYKIPLEAPLVVEISRFDPYKGPFELVAAFVKMVEDLEDADLQRKFHLVYASNSADDNPTAKQYADALKKFVGAIPVEKLPENLTGEFDIRKRIHILELKDKKEDGLEFTEDQRNALEGLFSRLKKHNIIPEDDFQRLIDNELNDKEMNALEVNAFQTTALIRAQFSSKEGFGLVVAEAMMKMLVDAVLGEETDNDVWGGMVATLVGGIKMQMKKENGIPIEYEEQDIDASLKVYRTLSSNKLSFEEIFNEVIKRKTVENFAEGMGQIAKMSTEELKNYNEKARRHISDNFYTHANIRNVIEAMMQAIKNNKINNEKKKVEETFYSLGNLESLPDVSYRAPVIEQAI